jgi:hypothetical protein
MSEPRQEEFALEPEYEIADVKRFEFTGAVYLPLPGEYDTPVEETVVGQYKQVLWVPTPSRPRTVKMHPMTSAHLRRGSAS